MRYFCYNEYSEDKNARVETVSEDELRPLFAEWKEEKVRKHKSRMYVEEIYEFQDFVDEWCLINGAWESKDGED